MKIVVTSQSLPAILMLRQGEFPAGVSVHVPSLAERRGVGFKKVSTAILTLRSGVAADVFANWLYEKLRDKPTTRVTINGTEVQIAKDEINRVIQEEIAKKERQ